MVDLQYTPTPHYFGSDTLQIRVDDRGTPGATGALRATAGVNIVITDVPEPVLDESGGRPMIDGPSSPLGFAPPVGGTTGPVDIGEVEVGGPISFGSSVIGVEPAHHVGAGPQTGEGLGGIGLLSEHVVSVLGVGHVTDSAGQPHVPGSGFTGLSNFYENIQAGKMLVFNLDDMYFTDLCMDCVLHPANQPMVPTGLAGYYEGIKEGKTLVFNLSNINCMDAICAVGG